MAKVTSWDKKQIDNFETINYRIRFVQERKDNLLNRWHFDLDGCYNLYFDELAIMIQYLQAIGEMRFVVNQTEPDRSGLGGI